MKRNGSKSSYSRCLPDHGRCIRFAMAALVFAVLYLATGGAYAQDALWRSYYTSAQKAYQQGNFIEAESLLKTALSATTQTEESLSSYFYLAHVCVRQEQYAEAEKYYRILLDELGTKTWAVLRPPDGTPDWEQDPGNVERTSDTRAFYGVLNKKPPQLLTVRLAKPITIVDVLSDYGTLMQLAKRYEEAEHAYRQALTLSDCRPDQATGYEARILQKLAVLYQLEGRTAELDAVQLQLANARNADLPDFDKIVNNTIKSLDKFGHNPHSQAIRLNNLALFCATHGDYGRAQSLFNRALSCLGDGSLSRHKKDRALILSNYSDLMLAMGRTAEATNLTRQAGQVASTTDQSSVEPGKSRGY